MDSPYEKTDSKEIGKDPLHILQGDRFRIDSLEHRVKRGTTIVHHRVRKRRPLRKGRRPAKSGPPKLRPVYGPPPTQIHIHQPNYPVQSLFSSPNRPEYRKQNSNHFAEPPDSSIFSIQSSVPFTPNEQREVTQFKSQQVSPMQPQKVTQISHQIGISNQQPPQHTNIYHNGQSIYQNSLNPYGQYSLTQALNVLPSSPTFETIHSPSYSSTSNAVIASPPTQSIMQITPVNNFQSSFNNRIPSSTISEIPTQSIPLDTSFQRNLYRNTISSYDVPLNSLNMRESNQKKNYESAIDTPLTLGQPKNSINHGTPTTQFEIKYNNYSPGIQPPMLPTRYEPSDFTSIQDKLPENQFNNAKNNDFFYDNSLEKYINDVSESKRVNVKTRPVKKSSKSKSKITQKTKKKASSGENTSSSFFDNEEEFSTENFPYKVPTTKILPTTTTKRPKHRRRKRPKLSKTTQHNFGANNIKDTFESGSEVQEYVVPLENNSKLDSEKYYKLSKTPIKLRTNSFIPISKPATTKPTTTNYIFVSSPKGLYDDSAKYHIRTKTENPTRLELSAFTYKPKRVRPTSLLQTVYQKQKSSDNSDEVNILSIQKSKSNSFYIESENENKNDNNNDFNIHFPFSSAEHDPDDLNSFTSGIYLANGGFGSRIKHERVKKDMENEEDYIFEAEYEIKLPSNHRFYKE